MKKYKTNTVLHTRDGRYIGNAIVIGHTDTANIIKTDYGNVVVRTDEEIEEGFRVAYEDLSPIEKELLEETLPKHKNAVSEIEKIGERLPIQNVDQQRELLLAYEKFGCTEAYWRDEGESRAKDQVDSFLSQY